MVDIEKQWGTCCWKHEAISIKSADQISIVLEQIGLNITYILNNIKP